MANAWEKLRNDPTCTQLPHYAINKSLPADSYFTSASLAKKCFDLLNSVVDTSGYTFIEPSAGMGSFYDLLPADRRIGIELYDRRPEFIQHDYLTWYPNDANKKYITIGNPPFGVRGAYALAFINRSFLFSDFVAFILPMSFISNGKATNMKRVQNGHLIFSKELNGEFFYSPDNKKNISINALFQIWKKGTGPSFFPAYDVSQYVDIYTISNGKKRECGLDKIGQYDFYVSSSFFGDKLSTVYKFEDVKYGSGYGVIIKNKKPEILSFIKNINWDAYAYVATNRCKHIRRYSIEKCLYEFGFGQIQASQNISIQKRHEKHMTVPALF